MWGEIEENSIAFGNAPQREADNQPIRQLVSQASTQEDKQTKTHSLGFFGGGLDYKQWGAESVVEQSAPTDRQ